MATDELPPGGALDVRAADAATRDTDTPAAAPLTSDAPSSDASTDGSAAAAPAAPAGGAEPGDPDATQAFDVAGLIAREKRATRRAVSAAEMDDPQPEPPLRRTRRAAATTATATADAADTDTTGEADQPGPTTAALAWVDPAALAARPSAPDALATSSHRPAVPDLLPPVPDRRRASVAAPLITAGAIALAYVGGCALWPLGAVAPTVSAATVEPAAGHPLGVTWPAEGSAAVGAEGLGTVAAANGERAPMASITKLVTVLMILEKAPLAPGEDGPSYDFSSEDSQLYWQYRYQNESALDVPVDGTLTERQLIEGILIGSANNYADRLTTELWGSKDAFVLAVPEWLEEHGLRDITLVDPSGIDPDNTATPAALVKLASLALADPVVSEIVKTREIELPGAGEVKNTNPLLEDDGVVGIKTGTLSEWWIESWNLLTAKDVTIGQTTVRLYAAVLGQPDAEHRDAVSRSLFDQVEKSLQSDPTVTAGTPVATITTEWGAEARVVTGEDATVVLWDSGLPDVDSDYDVEVGLKSGAEVGELTATGPFDTATVPLVLDGDVPGPDLIWRLTHPLDLFGLQ